MQNIYHYEQLMAVAEQERVRERWQLQRLREAGIAGRGPQFWFAIIAALLAFLRLG